MSSSPRRCLALALGCFLCACGNYSNAEVEYLNALPSREDLRSNLPETATSTGSRERRFDTLSLALAPDAPPVPALGMTSKLYEDTRGASRFFRALAEFLVTLIERVERLEPSERTEHLRRWGPYEWREYPGTFLQVVIERDAAVPTRFAYHFDFRQGVDGAWTTFLSGTFRATEVARRGVGHVFFDHQLLRDAGLVADAGMQNLDWVAVDYDSSVEPKTVSAQLQLGVLTQVAWAHADFADGSGRMSFTVDEWSRRLDVTSRWAGSGAGRADASVRDLLGPLGTVSQCWDAAFLLLWHQSSFEDPRLLGEETACPTPLPPP